MKYMILLYNNQQNLMNMKKERMQEIMAECKDYGQFLVDNGHFISASPLHPAVTGKTIRLTEGKPLVTDGPFAETKEQLGGYYLIDCGDFEEALKLAHQVPDLKYGASVEVRQVCDTDSL